MKIKPCPFCGGKVVVTRGIMGAPFLFFKCVESKCGAVISFDNMTSNLNPDKAYDNYNRRYEYESKKL